MNNSLDGIISLIGVACFGLLILPASLRWRMKEKATLTLSIYLALGLLWSIGVAVIALNVLPDDSTKPYFIWLTDISRSVMPLIFGALTLAFLGQQKGMYWYWGFGLVFLTFWIIVSLNLFGTANLILTYIPILKSTKIISSSLEILTWAVATVLALGALYISFKKYKQAQYRNRFRYWFGGTLVLSIANIIILSQIADILWIGSLLNIVGTLLITYIVMYYHPPDLRIVVNRIGQTLTVIMGLGILLFAALNIPFLLQEVGLGVDFLSSDSIIWFVILSITIAVFLPPLASWMDKTLGAVLFGDAVDESSTIQAYSQSINSDWDFQKLNQQALNFVLQEMNIKRGALFVDEDDSAGNVTLRLTASKEVTQEEPGYFAANDPFIIHFRQKQSPVTHYDLDVLPDYREMDEDSKNWLLNLDLDLFFPIILRQRDLVGVLALGPKPNYKSYTYQDLARLQVFASQIALDMDKAKLFGQLGSVNQKLGDLSKKFEDFDQGKTDFLSIASHELRTPLTHIHGYASMLLEASEDDLQNPAYLQHIFNGIAKGSGRLKSIVDLIFDVSRADIGELEIARDPISIMDIVTQAIENQDSALKERGHKLTLSGLDKLPTIEGDMAHLVQAFVHLLNNAIKYTPDNGNITLTGREIKEVGQPDKVEIVVTDTGIGIDPKDQTRIFDKFYRVGDVGNHSTGSVKFKGAGPGLGLPLVAGIAQAHGGEVWVESQEYNEETCPGSQFHLILPVKIPEEVESSNAKPSTAETRHWRKEDIKALQDKIAQEGNN